MCSGWPDKNWFENVYYNYGTCFVGLYLCITLVCNFWFALCNVDARLLHLNKPVNHVSAIREDERLLSYCKYFAILWPFGNKIGWRCLATDRWQPFTQLCHKVLLRFSVYHRPISGQRLAVVRSKGGRNSSDHHGPSAESVHCQRCLLRF